MNFIGKRSTMKVSLLLIVMLIAVLLGPTPASAAAEISTVSYRSLVDIQVGVPCSEEVAPELITLSGYVHGLFRVTHDAAGGFHVIGHSNYADLSGISSTTGDKYQGTGISRVNVNGKLGMEYNSRETFRVIGPGSGNNFLVSETFHFTINADGTITAYHDSFSLECK
jgi:hypothetical protein